jgi:methionyl-tRNA formyltransferase
MSLRAPHPDERPHRSLSLLFVGDPNLGHEGCRIVRRHFADATCVVWKRGDAEEEREIRALIRSRRWGVLLSFYNDLIFSADELAQADLALNVHPSSPRLRGVGYDTLPLIRGHSTYGVTLHHMTPEIDAGRIVAVMEEALPEGITYTALRSLTQRLCLAMLEQAMRMIDGLSEPLQLDPAHGLGAEAQWGHEYISRKALEQILDQLRRREPDHPVFR